MSTNPDPLSSLASDHLTDEDRELARLLEAATPGPWEVYGDTTSGRVRIRTELGDTICSWPFSDSYCPTWQANAELMAMSRNHCGDLLAAKSSLSAEVARLTAELAEARAEGERLRNLHRAESKRACPKCGKVRKHVDACPMCSTCETCWLDGAPSCYGCARLFGDA